MTLVFLHEGLGSVGQWRDFPRKLSETTGVPAFAYDRKGHGAATPLAGPRTAGYLREAALVELPSVLDREKITDPILVGHSDGGSIALIYAASHPVRSVITEAAHVFVEEAGLEGIRRTKLAFESGDLRQRLARYHGEKTDALFRAWADTWLSPKFRGFRIDLAAIHCPVLAIQGADDEYGTVAQLEAIASGVSGPVERLLIPNCGHAPHHQAPEATLRAMADFIQRLGAT